MSRPHDTEIHFREVLDLLGLPLPSGIQLLAVARFLDGLSSLGGADPYLIELVERVPTVRGARDVIGIDPVALDHALDTLQRAMQSSPLLNDAETAALSSPMYARGRALSFWMAGEHSQALRHLGVSPGPVDARIDGLVPPGSAEALSEATRVLSDRGMEDRQELHGLAAWLDSWNTPETVSVPAVEDVPESHPTGKTLHGVLRQIRLAEVEWAKGDRDEADANTALAECEGDWGAILAPALRAARSLLDEHGLHTSGRAVRLHLVFDRPGAFHRGMSANLGLAALVFCRLLRMRGSRDEYTLRPGLAMTGVVAEDGSVLPVEPRQLAAKVAAVFFSPVRHLVLPGAQVEPARRELARLCARYPRHLLELHGIAHLRELFFDRRLTDHRRIGVPVRIGRAAWRWRRPIAAIVLVALLAVLAASWIGPLDREPALVAFRGELLVLQNRSGQELRTITVGRRTVEHAQRLAAGDVHRDMVNLRDVDGDGDAEVLYIVHPPDGSRDPQALLCQGSREETPRWRFAARFPLRFPHKTEMASDAFRLEEIWTGDCDGDGRDEVILLANHVFFPSVIARLDASTGELEAHYVHVGTLGDMAVLDLDNDGFPEILACGTNNALNRASVLALDPRALNGYSPTAGAYTIEGLERARERSYVLIPRTPVGEAFASRHERNGALNLEIEPDGRIICIRVQDVGGLVPIDSVSLDGVLYYYFGFDLQCQRVASSNEFDTLGRLLWEQGRLPDPPGKEFLDAARRSVRYLAGDTAAQARTLDGPDDTEE